MKGRGVIVLASIAGAWVVAYMLWPHIVLPFANPLGITGQLTVLRFNPANNIVRYGVFIGAPALGFLAARGWRWARLPSREPSNRVAPVSLVVTVSVCAAIVLMRVALVFAAPMDERLIDYLHDGETLSAAYTYVSTGKLWTGTFFVHGLFYDVGRSFVAWRLFGHQTIGAMRLFNALMSQGVIVPMTVFLVTLAWSAWRDAGGWHALTTAAFMLFVYAISEFWLQQPETRDCYAFLVAAASVYVITRPRWWTIVIAGLFAGFGLFNTIERGVYMATATLSVWALYVVLRRERRDVIHLVSYTGGFALAFVVAGCLFGSSELEAFFGNLLYWARNKDLMDGFVYPRPSSDLIATLPLIFNALSFLGWAAALPSYVRDQQWTRLGINTFVVASACLFYRSALGRADHPHMIYVASLAYLSFAWTLVNWLPHLALRWACDACFVVLIFVAMFNVLRLVDEGRLLPSFFERAKEFVARDDEAFLEPDHLRGLNALRETFAGDACTFGTQPWPAMHYLLRKPSCSRFYLAWFATAVPFQREVIATLEAKKPAHVMLWSDKRVGMDNFRSAETYSELDAYLRTHYPAEPPILTYSPRMTDKQAWYMGLADWMVGTRTAP